MQRCLLFQVLQIVDCDGSQMFKFCFVLVYRFFKRSNLELCCAEVGLLTLGESHLDAGLLSQIFNFVSANIQSRNSREMIKCLLLDGHDLVVKVEPVGDPLEAGDLLILSLHHSTHLLHLASEIIYHHNFWNTCDARD